MSKYEIVIYGSFHQKLFLTYFILYNADFENVLFCLKSLWVLYNPNKFLVTIWQFFGNLRVKLNKC